MTHMLRLWPDSITRFALTALLTLTISVSSSGCASSANIGLPTAEPDKGPMAEASSSSPADAFPVFDEDFARYRAAVNVWLHKRSMSHRSSEDIELNLPFELSASKAVAYQGRYLLFHGLNDSPYVWRNMATELSNRGFDVRAVLFEGHGSTPKDMLKVQWEAWLNSAREHLQAWQSNGVPMHLGGFSMGAVIATWLALDNPEIASLLLISPAFESRLNRYLRWSGLYAKFRPWVFGGMILEDNPIKYNSIPINSGWQYFQLTRGLKRRWGWREKITIPTLMVLTEDDSVVNHDYTQVLYHKRFVSDRRSMIIYSARSKNPNAVTDNQAVDTNSEASAAHVGYPVEEYRSSAFVQRRILNQSHLGLMYSPMDPLFGQAASVLVCNGNEYPVFIACMRSTDHWFGAQHTVSPDGVPVARTTYNADWQGVLKRLDEVLLLSENATGKIKK
ncbi:MAG: alpha/beta hydrolase [Granulosicoccus sp.]